MNALLVRAVLAFLALPGMVAYAVPLLLIAPRDSASFHPVGMMLVVPGTGLLLWCVYEFYTAGRGTLAPWTPPSALVVTGLYRFSRNPMYVAVALILIGWALGYRSPALAIYAFAVCVAFHLRVVLNEEPFLARTQGEEWVRYKSRVPRWIGLGR